MKLGKLIKDFLPFLYSDEEVQKVLSPPPLVSYRSARKIKDYMQEHKGYYYIWQFYYEEKVTKSTKNLTAMISAWSTSSAVEHMR